MTLPFFSLEFKKHFKNQKMFWIIYQLFDPVGFTWFNEQLMSGKQSFVYSLSFRSHVITKPRNNFDFLFEAHKKKRN